MLAVAATVFVVGCAVTATTTAPPPAYQGVEPGVERQSPRLRLQQLRAAGAQPRQLPVELHERSGVRGVHLRQPGRTGAERPLLAQECRAGAGAGDLLRLGDEISGRAAFGRSAATPATPPPPASSWQGTPTTPPPAPPPQPTQPAAAAAPPASSWQGTPTTPPPAPPRRRRRAAGRAGRRRRPRRPRVGSGSRRPIGRAPTTAASICASRAPSCAATPAGASPSAARSPTYVRACRVGTRVAGSRTRFRPRGQTTAVSRA